MTEALTLYMNALFPVLASVGFAFAAVVLLVTGLPQLSHFDSGSKAENAYRVLFCYAMLVTVVLLIGWGYLAGVQYQNAITEYYQMTPKE